MCSWILYAIPENLYLELRCIHPGTGEVRTLWGRIGDKRALTSILKEAEQLNDEGFGIYFAPCLRREKKGTADSAAWVSALWIDVDSTDQRDMANLQGFEPAPSFIVSSGGGWHAYWLLEEPFQLNEESDREKIAAILHSLFSALGGDSGYVKSVASMMRLPESRNTKPDRDNALAEIIESHPDRCYPLSSFDWLETKPKPKIDPVGKVATVSHRGDGYYPLPPRTQQYLESGAVDGSRNAELFAAACQMRDAGYSQSEAEAELVPRHVADGNGNESASAREKEARATIASAYSQPPREPILKARDRVAQLLNQYDKQEHPTTEQITEAVKSCVGLNAIEWAEERQRLKAICGNGLKVSDLDRLYRDTKKQAERAEAATFQETEGYVESDGKLIYQRQTARGLIEKAVADWTGQVIERISRVDDDGEVEHVAVLRLQRGESQTTVDVPSETFGDDAALRRFIAGRAGETFTVRAGMAKHLTPAILSLSGAYPTRTSYRFMGWTRIDDRWTYITSENCVNADGAVKNSHEVELETRLRDYKLTSATWEDGIKAFEAMIAVFPPELAPTLIAFAWLPLFQRFFPTAAHKPALHLVGTTGSGKSEIASLMTSLYGTFFRDTPPAQWGDTVNTVETLGYSLADALYWVDDFKHIYADNRTFTRFLQSYSRGMGRGRLTREAKIRQERACRGHVLSTGETTIEGEPSVLARMIVLELPPWEGRDPAGNALVEADKLRHHLPGFTVQLAKWIASQADTGNLTQELTRRFESCVTGYRQQLNAAGVKANSTGRIIGNWSVLTAVYQMLDNFLDSHNVAHILPGWQSRIVETAKSMQEERPSRIYIDIIQQLAAIGRVIIEDPSRPKAVSSQVPVIGYQSDGFIYIIPDIAYREVCKVQPVNFTLQAIGNQLKEDGLLIPGSNNLSTQKRVNGQRVRVWQFAAEILG